jgi:hypothetical protein
LKKFLFALVFVISSSAFAADKFDLNLSPSVGTAINAVTSSCLAKRNAGPGNPPVYDVTANFAQFKGLTFSFPSQEKALVISTVEVRFKGFAVTIAGDALNCLNNTWYQTGEAVVGGPVRAVYSDNTKTYQPKQTVAIEFPLQLSGLPSGRAYEAKGTMTVYGQFENQAGDVEDAQATVPLTIKWRGR